MNRCRLLSRNFLALLAVVVPTMPTVAQQPNPSRSTVVSDLVALKRIAYNCSYRRMQSVLTALFSADPTVWLVYRDWPVFGVAFQEAARAAVESQGQDKYGAFYEALLASPEGLDSSSPMAAAANVKVNWPRLQRGLQTRGGEIDALLAQTNAVSDVIGFNGTRALIIGSQVVAGAIDLPTLRRLLAAAFSKPRTS